MLYAQYWPEDAGALYGETEVESMCHCFNIANLLSFFLKKSLFKKCQVLPPGSKVATRREDTHR